MPPISVNRFPQTIEWWKAANYAKAGMFRCHVYPASRAIDVSSKEAGHPAGSRMLQTFPMMPSQLAYNAQKSRGCHITKRNSAESVVTIRSCRGHGAVKRTFALICAI